MPAHQPPLLRSDFGRQAGKQEVATDAATIENADLGD
jgi:hypothetical protein